MIKIMRSFNDGKIETEELNSPEFPPYDGMIAMMEKMDEKACHTLVVTLSEGFQVLYTRTASK